MSKRVPIGPAALLFTLLALVFCAAGCASRAPEQGAPAVTPPAQPKLQVVTTTSLIADVAKAVGGDRVQVTNIIPPASCPGHFDIKPGDLKALADARLFMLHDWQGEKFSDGLIRSAGNPALQKVVLDIQGNWMAPPVQAQAIERITAALEAADPANAAAYRAAAAALADTVQRTGQELKARLEQAEVKDIKVLCADMQAGFVKWMGFTVVGVYGRPEDTTPQQMEEMLAKARQEGVTLVIDNLQSGHEAGVGMAKELGAEHVTLSNFPGGLPDTETWEKAVRKNVDLVLEAIGK
ncbi:MAG: metal ABC transporter substrate-binding protein [Bacillota bacterium]|nr:metal ABC transporter substrate-binding protein [Bacillota bacterium]